MKKSTFKYNIFLLAAAVIWGFAFVAQCNVQGKINIFLFIGARFLLGSASLLPVIFLLENKGEKKAQVKPSGKMTVVGGAVCGTILFIASALQQWGINISPSAGKAGFITGIYTVLVPIFYFLFFRKKTGLNVCLGAICAVAGLYLLSVTDGIESIGFSDIVIFIGAIFWALHILTIDRFISKVSPIKFSAVQFGTAGIIGTLLAFTVGGVSFAEAPSQILAVGLPLLYVGICSSGIAYTCQVLGQRGANPTYAAIILSLESVFAAVGGAIFGIDNMSVRSYIGCAVIFAGIIISQIDFQIKKKASGN